MRSETLRPAAGRAPRWTWLSSQGLGVLCGQATAVLLAAGSIVLAVTREGASASIVMDDLRWFFKTPSVVHIWLYLLVGVLSLYAVNAALATWQSVLSKWRARMRAAAAYAPAVIHVSFLIALLAHLVGGMLSEEMGSITVGTGWQRLGDGRAARLVALNVERLPDGSTKQVRANVEVQLAGGEVSESTVTYNGPISSGLGSDLLLLIRPVALPGAVHLVRGEDRCEIEVNGRCDLGDARARLLFLHPPARSRGPAMARVRIVTSPDAATQELWLMQGYPKSLGDGSTIVLERINIRPAILLRRRHAPGNPLALLAAIMLVVGLAMMWRRFL